MCGICGIVDFRCGAVDPQVVLRMRDVMVARGPDDAGLHVEPSAVLGHRRLSIIDLSPLAAQPMTNEDRSVWVVFNGEIYNFLELREELAAQGHRFNSRSDTEVLLHGYEQWGLEGLARRILGMFAVALWDSRSRQVHFLRDPLGKKPLFYRFDNGRLWFSSDIKSIHLACGDSLALDPQAIDEYLYYYCIGQERTIFAGVHRCPPGHVATVDARGVQLSRTWRPDFSRKQARTKEEWLEGVDFHLHQAVKRRLIADVPLGAFLSGGVDSSCVCAVMAGESSGPPKTFSVGFADAPAFDERIYSRRVAQHIGSEHTELVVEPDLAGSLSQIVWQCGEPFGDSSLLPSYFIAQEAAKVVKVVLTGDGGDEAFAGYGRQLRADKPRQNAWLPGLIRNGLIPMLSRAAGAAFPLTLFARNFELFSGYLSGNPEAFAVSTCWFDGYRDALYTDDMKRRLDGFHPRKAQRELLGSLSGKGFVDQAMEYIQLTTLPNDYLVKVDLATASHALEARCPFLDVPLLEFAATIPTELLIENHEAKALLKRYTATLVPPEVVYRRKHGFSIPIKQWFRGDWRTGVANLLLSEQALSRGYFRPEMVRKVLTEHASGQRNHEHRIWSLLVLEIWQRLFMDKTLKPGDPVF